MLTSAFTLTKSSCKACAAEESSNFQFEIFTHDYRERKEAPQCEDHGSSKGSCCSSPSSDVDWKKRFVNASRKLQKAVLALQRYLLFNFVACKQLRRVISSPPHGFRMPNSEVIAEMLQKMREINDRLNEFSKQRQAEFSTTTVALPQFDATDMGLLLGEKEVSLPRCSFIAVEKCIKECVGGSRSAFPIH